MDAAIGFELVATRRKKRFVGAIAVTLLLLFTVLEIIRVFSLIEWLIADAAVALVANFILSRVGRQTKQ